MKATKGSLGINGVFQFVLVALLLACTATSALAERREESGDDATRKAQYLLRQMQAELQKAKTENAGLQGELDKLKGKQGDLEKQLESSEQKLSSSSNRNSALNDRLQKDGDKYRALMTRYRETVADLRKTQFKVAYMQEAVLERNQWISVCQENNEKMYTANNELLEAYRDKGLMASLSQSAPVTGLAMVRAENLVEDYRYRLEDLKMLDFKGTAPHETAAVDEGGNGG